MPNFWTFVENCKLLKICTIHKRSVITSCSCTITVNLAIVTKRLKSNGGNRFFIKKHEFEDFKSNDLKNI